jgi:cytochrome P450
MVPQITSKQLRDDLMTMLIAGHETTAAVLTWTLHCLAERPDVLKRLQQEVHSLQHSRCLLACPIPCTCLCVCDLSLLVSPCQRTMAALHAACLPLRMISPAAILTCPAEPT